MGLFFSNRKKNESTEVAVINSDLIVDSKPVLHEDLVGLIWIGDGPYKNYSPDNNKKQYFEVDGMRVSFSFMQQDEPSLLYTQEKIAKPSENVFIERPPYFPTYKQLTPEQKWIYLNLLTNPYNQEIDIGYIFILYYGLERHLLSGDFENAFKVILRLRDVHRNKSFQSYSANAIVLSCMLQKRGDLALEFINSLDKEYEYAFSDNLFLICYFSFNLPLTAKDIMRMSKTFEFTNTNYIKKYPIQFEEALQNVLTEKTEKNTILLNTYFNKTEIKKIKMQEVPIFANTSIIDNKYMVPILSENFKLKKDVFLYLDEAHNAVKKQISNLKKSGATIISVEKPKADKKQIKYDAKQEKCLLAELDRNLRDPVGRHFSYLQIQDFYYKYRDVDQVYLDKCLEFALRDISELYELQDAYVKKEIETVKTLAKYQEKQWEQQEIEKVKERGFNGNIPSFKRAVIIYEKLGLYDKAIEICNKAIIYGQSVDEFADKIQKINKKKKA